MTTAVITIVAGRHDHLLAQQRGLLLGTRVPEMYVVVAMGDPLALQLTAAGPIAGSGCVLLMRDVTVDGPLPLAAARNVGAVAALAAGADVLIFLDVDCVPSPPLVAAYDRAVRTEARPALHCGVVQYLDEDVDAMTIHPAELAGRPHVARPQPMPGVSTASDDWQLFWSLSFAVSNLTWQQLDGFCEGYRGYGAEDTDFGYHAHLSGINVRWLGGADAFHQYHESQNPPVPHLADVVRNATIFHRRWGFWPMQGWLQAFCEMGLAKYHPELDQWAVVEANSVTS